MKKFKSSNETRHSTVERPPYRRRTHPVFMLAAAILFCALQILLPAHQPALADITFNQALDTQLDGVTIGSGAFEPCARLVGRDRTLGTPVGFGPELTAICTTVPPAGGGGTVGASAQASAGGGVTATPPVVERRQKRLREDEDQGTDDSGDVVVTLGSRFAVFISGQYEDLDRDQTAFEDGYDSDIWGITLGADYRISSSAVAGLALNLSNWDGDYDTGGGFDTDSYGATVFASFLPLNRLFVDVALGFARNDISEDRRRFYDRVINDTTTFPPTTTEQVFGGRVDADRDDHMISAIFRMGYDIPIRQFTIGPRLELDYRYLDIDNYTEKGKTGLELQYQSDSRTLFQSNLGLLASMAISTRFGVILPQLEGYWVHEFADKQRSISSQFAQDLRTNPTRFSFDTDSPDKNWWEFGGGLVFVMPRGFQAFAHYRTLTNHDYLDSQTVSAGLRVEF